MGIKFPVTKSKRVEEDSTSISNDNNESR